MRPNRGTGAPKEPPSNQGGQLPWPLPSVPSLLGAALALAVLLALGVSLLGLLALALGVRAIVLAVDRRPEEVVLVHAKVGTLPRHLQEYVRVLCAPGSVADWHLVILSIGCVDRGGAGACHSEVPY